MQGSDDCRVCAASTPHTLKSYPDPTRPFGGLGSLLVVWECDECGGSSPGAMLRLRVSCAARGIDLEPYAAQIREAE